MKTTKGKFDITGYYKLSDEVKRMVWKEVKVGDNLILEPDCNNTCDKYAIKVLFNGIQIGWYAATGYRQNELFNELVKGNKIKTTVVSNNREQTRYGQQQFVKGEFSYEKEEAKKEKEKPVAKEDKQLLNNLESASEKLKTLLKNKFS
jgi:hypothetical protein